MGLVAFYIGPVPVYWYGFTAAVAVTVAFVAAWLIFYFREETTVVLWDVFICALPVSLVFARLAHALKHYAYYSEAPLRIIDLSAGGFSQYGAAFGFLLAVCVYAYCTDQPIWHLLDLLAVPVVLALAVMQVGHFFMQLTVGAPLPDNVAYEYTLAEYIEFRYRPSGFENYEYFLPVALYQAVLQLVTAGGLCAAMLFSGRLWQLNEGCVFLLAVIICSLIRFGCGFLYLSVQPGLHFGQIISLIAAGLALFCLFGRLRQPVRYY